MVLYLECNMGAAGDMLTAALLELVDDKGQYLKVFNNLVPGRVCVKAEDKKSCGIKGTHVHVYIDGEEEESVDDHETHGHDHIHEAEGIGVDEVHNHEHNHDGVEHEHHGEEHVHSHDEGHHHHADMSFIKNIVANMDIPGDAAQIKRDIMAVYQLIAEAESKAHGVPVTEIHFHEVGALDAICDVANVCILMNAIGADKVICSPVNTGFGNVKCSHGIMPIPAPATAHLLEGMPSYAGNIRGEMCTPTGAALLRYFADECGNRPVMEIVKTGYGMGTKEFEQANCIRAFLGNSLEASPKDLDTEEDDSEEEVSVAELRCNLDDMTPEEISFATESLMEAGALDVWTQNIGMKKNRPGVMLCVLCAKADKEKFAKLIFKHTTTIGIRESICNRYVLNRAEKTKNTDFGAIRVKKVSGYGVERKKPEYEDLARLAREQDMSLLEVKKIISESKR